MLLPSVSSLTPEQSEGSFAEYRREIRRRYDGAAGAFLLWGSILSLHEPLVGRLLRDGGLDLSKCRRILDVGSGAGQVLTHILEQKNFRGQVVAFDLSHQMLCRARARVTRGPMFVAGDITALPFADASFDCITCGWVLEHLPDPRAGLAELARVLEPGGKLLLLTTEDTLAGRALTKLWNCRTYVREELRSVCDAVGIAWEEELWFTPIHRALRLGGIAVRARKASRPSRGSVRNTREANNGKSKDNHAQLSRTAR